MDVYEFAFWILAGFAIGGGLMLIALTTLDAWNAYRSDETRERSS
jgi:hypothetical protein